VWGCLAYVHIQKDKRKGFSPHMEKGIFIGYPDGYKGWKFYIPSTKKAVISERADFDERYFPGLKKDLLAAVPNNYYPPAAPPQIVQMPELEGDIAPPNTHAKPIVPAPAPAHIPQPPAVQNEEDNDIPDIPDPDLLLHPNQNQFSPDVVIVPETHQVNGGRSDTHLHKLMMMMMMMN
jgi:hypothetical protein